MKDVILSTRIGRRAQRALQAYCERHGLRIGHFVEQAILDRLEEASDVKYIQEHLDEPSRTLAAVLHELRPSKPVSRRRQDRRRKTAS